MAEAATATEETSETEGQEQEQETEQKTRTEIPPEVAAALRKANKEAETARRRLKELEDRDKNETQKATDRATQAEKDAAEARAAYLRLKVGTTKGLAPSIAERLHGDTEEEMAADADALLAALKSANGNGRPGSFDAGAKSSPPAAEDMNALIRRAAGRA